MTEVNARVLDGETRLGWMERCGHEVRVGLFTGQRAV
jgi:hypothetical protein